MKLEYDKLLSTFGFKCKLRHYSQVNIDFSYNVVRMVKEQQAGAAGQAIPLTLIILTTNFGYVNCHISSAQLTT